MAGRSPECWGLGYTAGKSANWKATHRLAGKLMVVFGLALAVLNTFYVNPWLLLALCIGPLLLPVLYSPWYYFRYEKSAESGPGDQ